MFVITTRSFPPEVGGMQVLMGGLSESLLNHGPVKVFTFEHKESQIYDNKSGANIERIKGIKLFRKLSYFIAPYKGTYYFVMFAAISLSLFSTLTPYFLTSSRYGPLPATR